MLKDVIRRYDIKQADLMKLLDITSQTTISHKLNGKSDFSVKEAKLIIKYLEEKTGLRLRFEDLF